MTIRLVTKDVEPDLIEPPVMAYSKPAPGKNRAYIFEFGEERGRMIEVDSKTGRIYAEGVENYWFRMPLDARCPSSGGACPILSLEERERSLQFYFNLDRKKRGERRPALIHSSQQ